MDRELEQWLGMDVVDEGQQDGADHALPCEGEAMHRRPDRRLPRQVFVDLGSTPTLCALALLDPPRPYAGPAAWPHHAAPQVFV